jgi:hypothetical protein
MNRVEFEEGWGTASRAEAEEKEFGHNMIQTAAPKVTPS